MRLATPPQATAPVPPPSPVIGKNDAGETAVHTGDGKTCRLRDARRVIRVDKDGRVTTQGGGADLTDVPDVSSINCKEGDDGRPVIQDDKTGRRRIIICRNRAQRLASEGAVVAANAQDLARGSLAHALTSLRLSRPSIATNPNLTDAQRRSALAGIDQAIAELAADNAAN